MLKNIAIPTSPNQPEIVYDNKFATTRLVPSIWGPHISIQSGTSGGAVIMVVDPNQSTPKLLLINQPRYALTTDGTEHNGYYTWEFPRGGQKPEETPLECAIRELREETNLTNTTPETITHLGTAHTDTGILNSTVNYFYIEIDSTNPDIKYNDNEIINHVWIELPDFVEEIRNNNIQDAYTLTAYAKALTHGLLPLT